ncbi:hypothetical protein SAMD00019534_047950 [Acytostelium subglobosum LB1]|uniref:hypothetical protein n=1 Tax=Acytostelium subglobosum LB1 TaxID=1410327 RepID=UPI000644B630|nr:hypothetical protein SAMD00019534_047950 [Acytostelium subglobosum LB1]GAM21620.1 hypothetical protein SAMD00019534_047950 [Acytostelium subglobosum LB1]|eukprot:XP_012755739.1 hypothetical protein SAMD00019534_047950 [Acytostelium subglobosum LB1]
MSSEQIKQLDAKLDNYHLLTHDFYKKWSHGELTLETLKVYAGQYYHHVDAFPRYISTIHSKCDDIKSRQVLLGNLTEEESGEENHPELWMRFAEGLGNTREAVKSSELLPKTKALVDGYYDLCNESYAKGLGALYAYERQVPEVAKSKIDGLEKFYGINNERALKFFVEHITADEWHSEECAALIDKLSEEDRKVAEQGAEEAAKLLWGFLDGMMAVSN